MYLHQQLSLRIGRESSFRFRYKSPVITTFLRIQADIQKQSLLNLLKLLFTAKKHQKYVDLVIERSHLSHECFGANKKELKFERDISQHLLSLLSSDKRGMNTPM